MSQETSITLVTESTFSNSSLVHNDEKNDSEEEPRGVTSHTRRREGNGTGRPNNRGPCAKYWCFTSFKEDANVSQGPGVTYFVAQIEICPNSGRRHWQGYLELQRKQRATWIKTFLGDPACHLELRKGTGEEAAAYCKKDETAAQPYVRSEWGSLAADGPNGESSKRKFSEVMERAVATGSRKDAISILRSENFGKLATSFINIRACINHFIPEEEKQSFVYKPIFAWKLPTGIQDWLTHEFTKTERCKLLILSGPTRLGKTNWARSLGPHMFWRNEVNFGQWDQNAKYIVVDDIEWRYVRSKKAIFTQMGDITLTDKYVKKINVNNDKPAIFLTNSPDPVADFGEDASYWQANTVIVKVDTLLYDTQQRAII